MKRRRHIPCLALTAFVLAVTLQVALPVNNATVAPRINFFSSVCGEFADTLEPDRTWIPVGCEAGVCCPGCPNGGIDWRIRVSGEPLESAVFQFDNLSAAAVRKLRINGKARWEGSALRVWPGETVVSGFNYDPRAVPAVATPRLFGNRDSLRKLQVAAERENTGTGKQAAHSSADRTLARMEVFVEQLIGKYPVSEARVVYNVKGCTPQPSSGDRILLNNNRLNDNVIALIDARSNNNCLRDTFFRGVTTVNLGDLQPFDICFSETSIFSDDNGMYYVKPDIWTLSQDEEHIVTLPEMFVAPVAVWFAISDPLERANARLRAERDMANANFLYNTHKVGIRFEPTYADAVGLAAIADRGCNNASRVRVSDFYRLGQLNVYYINSSTATWFGWNCSEDDDLGTANYDPNVIFVNSSGLQETLAHEFGHAFSLCHPDKTCPDKVALPGIGSNNIMWSGGSALSPRTDFTVGQAFRMNMNSTSMMNVNLLRLGWSVRDPPCLDSMTTDLCPQLSLDVPPPK